MWELRDCRLAGLRWFIPTEWLVFWLERLQEPVDHTAKGPRNVLLRGPLRSKRAMGIEPTTLSLGS
jgi:hypothetical protein